MKEYGCGGIVEALFDFDRNNPSDERVLIELFVVQSAGPWLRDHGYSYVGPGPDPGSSIYKDENNHEVYWNVWSVVEVIRGDKEQKE